MLIYRVPSEPASKRVSVWRELKTLGALHLQQCVCLVPDLPVMERELAHVTSKIAEFDGDSFVFFVPRLAPTEESRITATFREQRAEEYGDITTGCEKDLAKKIEFERYRGNYTVEQANEFSRELEKIQRSYSRIRERDWFDAADGRMEAEAALAHCRALVTAFQADVDRRTNAAGHDAH